MTIYESFQAGGWAMFFVLAFGLLSVGAAARFFWRGDPSLEAFSCWMMRATGLSALFGFLVGMIKVVGFIAAHAKNLDERIQVLIEGTGESLNNLTLGFLLMTLSCLLLGIGQRRFPARVGSFERNSAATRTDGGVEALHE